MSQVLQRDGWLSLPPFLQHTVMDERAQRVRASRTPSTSARTRITTLSSKGHKLIKRMSDLLGAESGFTWPDWLHEHVHASHTPLVGEDTTHTVQPPPASTRRTHRQTIIIEPDRRRDHALQICNAAQLGAAPKTNLPSSHVGLSKPNMPYSTAF